ncbi:hypothetical protein BN159_4229 [Streptomyces davaonensis JCM 4913]|uniref:Uncharacterized protein n=1 Tax=Streptomyces davaonensis (strain DSM 101723 / JCM 4913 / KCC S-0913 / 768) TaxID=1214101 RepID=K4R5H4_STRDJ|nr:hypothetical protein [Streptomyces davaonensis]CCK28608.1 hypothetical protein BN159_4229 [Streptomyces davaonensis JCM 4913]
MTDLDGKRFRNPAYGDRAPVALYRQDGDLLWASFEGGDVRKGALSGRRLPDGSLEFGYTMVMISGEVIAGRCNSVPEIGDDGRVTLHETWERYGPHAATGVSLLREV